MKSNNACPGTHKVWDPKAPKVGYYADVTTAKPLGVPSSCYDFAEKSQAEIAETKNVTKATKTSSMKRNQAKKARK